MHHTFFVSCDFMTRKAFRISELERLRASGAFSEFLSDSLGKLGPLLASCSQT